MVHIQKTFVALGCLLPLALGAEFTLSEKDAELRRCNGMYSKDDFGGSVDPYIMTVFENSTEEDKDPLTSFVLFEWRDEHLLGQEVKTEDGVTRTEYICSKDAIAANLCDDGQEGEFLMQANASAKWKQPIITTLVHGKDAHAINYDIKKTGYYCVWTYQYSEDSYKGLVEFRNAYGELPAAQIPKLPFYGGLTIVYALIGAFWAFLYVQNRHDILPVQNYITAIIVFLIIEQLMTWGYYDYQNNNGNNLGNKVLMTVVAILNAGRNSFSFFLLLIVCMGYGVVKQSLGKTMLYVRILALTHFVFGVIYSVASLTITPDSAGPLVLLVIMPLAATLTAFYVWTLNSLSFTMKDLLERKQSVKALMYKRLWWCILGSIIVIFVFFFFNSFTFASRGDPDFVPNNWKTRWFVLDGWLNLVYLFDICFVAYLWRPTANNRRFAMSDEIAQDEDGGFEIASFGNSLSEDEEEGRPRANGSAPRRDSEDSQPQLSPVPPKPVNDRPSLDGETIFAVGDEDKFSDDDSPRNSSERKGLTSGR